MDRAHCVIDAHSPAPHLRLGLAYTQVRGHNDFHGQAFVWRCVCSAGAGSVIRSGGSSAYRFLFPARQMKCRGDDGRENLPLLIGIVCSFVRTTGRSQIRTRAAACQQEKADEYGTAGIAAAALFVLPVRLVSLRHVRELQDTRR